MKIRCLHGYFIFQETKVGQVSDFMNYTGLSLVAKDDFYVFEDLKDCPEYSLAGSPLLGIPAIESYAGKPWEIFRANGFVYNFDLGQVRPIASITIISQIKYSGNLLVSNGLIMPGSVTADGSRVKDYAAWFSRDTLSFKYSEVSFD